MRTARTLLATASTVLALTLTACQPGTLATDTPGGAHPNPGTSGSTDRTTAHGMLATLAVRAEDTGAHYHRKDWGDWNPTAHGCDTRGQVLREQGTEVTVAPGCRLRGRWVSPYDGQTFTNPAGLQIDHRVPLKEAMRSGARGWTRAEREFFYNDLVNLVAVSANSNASKGAKDPGRWRPPNRDHWCAYADGYITTKYAYHLTVDQPEHDALVAMLRTCR